MTEPSRASRGPRRPARGGVPVAAILLIVIGGLLLLQTTGVIAWSLWGTLWRFWPVLIIAAGVSVLLGGRAPWLAAAIVLVLILGAVGLALGGGVRDRALERVELREPVGSLTAMDVSVRFGAGKLRVHSLPEGSTQAVEAVLDTPGRAAEARLTRSGDRGTLRIEMPSRTWIGPSPNAEWDVALSRTPRLTVDLNAGASDVDLDFRDLLATNIDVNVGAADLHMVMPARAGRVDATVDAGASSIEVTVPQGVAARIRRSAGLSSFNVDQGRFPRSGDYFVSPDFDTAANRVTLELRVGAASVDVR